MKLCILQAGCETFYILSAVLAMFMHTELETSQNFITGNQNHCKMNAKCIW